MDAVEAFFSSFEKDPLVGCGFDDVYSNPGAVFVAKGICGGFILEHVVDLDSELEFRLDGVEVLDGRFDFCRVCFFKSPPAFENVQRRHFAFGFFGYICAV